MTTGFFYDERCFWHGGGNYAFTLPVGDLVQPIFGGLPENPETKRRLKNLMDVTGLSQELDMLGSDAATFQELARVHPENYLNEFKNLSDNGGGELGLRTPFGKGGYEIAALSAGLAKSAIFSVLNGTHENSYALSRPPGHHCLPDFPNGFCLLANIAVGIEAAIAEGKGKRFAVLDWDVHHGNGTEAIFYDRNDVLTISIHQENNYPMDTGSVKDQGKGAGLGYNMNIPLPPGAGHNTYIETMERIALPAIENFAPDIIIIACGFDASAVDPLSRMLATMETFRAMTEQVKTLASKICDGRLMMAHEGGYSEVYVPFCGHAVLAEMAGSKIIAPDPFGKTFDLRQPSSKFEAAYSAYLDEIIEQNFPNLSVSG